MTKTHRATKIAVLVLTFIMLFSVVCIAGTASAGAATGTDIVSLYSAGKTFSKYGNTSFNGTETWTTFINAGNTNYKDFQYAICYRVNGSEFWANNHGANYDFNYCIHQ